MRVPLPKSDVKDDSGWDAYSFLNATIGSTPTARLTGTSEATIAAAASIPAAASSIAGFHGCTPNS